MTQNYVILLEFFLFTNVGHKSKRKTRFKSLMTKSGPIGQISCYAKIVLCVRIMGLYTFFRNAKTHKFLLKTAQKCRL